MGEMVSEALVLFDATGDLAYKKFLRALQAMVKRGHLNAIEMDGSSMCSAMRWRATGRFSLVRTMLKRDGASSSW
jgi:glucose-6-phosphate 1-dehydrogenase